MMVACDLVERILDIPATKDEWVVLCVGVLYPVVYGGQSELEDGTVRPHDICEDLLQKSALKGMKLFPLHQVVGVLGMEKKASVVLGWRGGGGISLTEGISSLLLILRKRNMGKRTPRISSTLSSVVNICSWCRWQDSGKEHGAAVQWTVVVGQPGPRQMPRRGSTERSSP